MAGEHDYYGQEVLSLSFDEIGKSLRTSSFLIEVQRGNVSGVKIVHKFGTSSVGTTLQPVTLSGTYKTPTSATALEFVSDNTNDTSDGAGAREITIIGLDNNWKEVVQTIETSGTAPVALPTDLTRLYCWYVSKSGTYADGTNFSHAGTLTIREAGGGDVWSTINTTPAPLGQSQIGVYTIPAGKSGFILTQDVYVDSNKVVDFILFQRPSADTVSAPYSPMRVVNKFIGVSGWAKFDFNAPIDAFVGPCDIGYLAKTGTGTADITVNFEILLVDD